VGDGTYENCYDILSDVREGLHDHSTALVQGTDTAGSVSNTAIIRQINAAQRFVHLGVRRRDKGIFIESADIVGASSVFTLPWDFGSIRLFKDASGNKVFPVSIESVPNSSGTGNKREYYRKGNTLILTKSGVSDTYTLWYNKKPRDITTGKAQAGAATSITLAVSAKMIADYYNGLGIEDKTAAFVDTITDYSAARVAVITNTGVADDYYGIVSELPEPFHFLLAPLAIILMKMQPDAEEPPGKLEVEMWNAMFIAAMVDYVGSDEDISAESIWCDYGGMGSGGVNIPGQGYTIPD